MRFFEGWETNAVLHFRDFLQIVIRDIEDQKANDDAGDCRPCVIIAKKKHVDPIEHVPRTAPDENQSEDDAEIMCEIPYCESFGESDHVSSLEDVCTQKNMLG